MNRMQATLNRIAPSALFIAGFCFLSAMKVADCNGYYAMSKGSRIESSVYDDKNSLVSKNVLEIIDSKKVGGKTVSTAKNITENFKKKKTTETVYDFECDGQGTTVNVIQLMQENLKQNKQIGNANASGNNPVFPHQMSVGQTLPESNIVIDVSGEISLKSKIKIFDRKVVGTETITVPAGTFDCVVITYTEDIAVLVDEIKKYKVWMAKGVGIVRNEQYSKKGKLVLRSEMTKFSQ
jgi:hypothetical protein